MDTATTNLLALIGIIQRIPNIKCTINNIVYFRNLIQILNKIKIANYNLLNIFNYFFFNFEESYLYQFTHTEYLLKIILSDYLYCIFSILREIKNFNSSVLEINRNIILVYYIN